MSRFDDDSEDTWRFHCMVSTRDDAPLLEQPDLAYRVIEILEQAANLHTAHLWGHVVLPRSVEFVVEVPTETTYHVLVKSFKIGSEAVLVEMIRKSFPALQDHITFFNPAWTQPSFLIWRSGYHTQLLGSLYAMSNKIADLVNKPVQLGLVDHPSAWPFSSYQHNDTP